jgi:hypothetical protein
MSGYQVICKMRKLLKILKKLEGKILAYLSHNPILYGVIGGVGVVLFWRGVWHGTDFIMAYFGSKIGDTSINLTNYVWWDGPISLIIGFVILIITGIFVSSFIGNEVIISGLHGERKLTEKTEKELRTEAVVIDDIKNHMDQISDRLEMLEKGNKK